jgi:UDP-GlcNAc:undecaprenyl-phosphate/decaprenyl-phosphate GlcNAc-1-phosphate transferase
LSVKFGFQDDPNSAPNRKLQTKPVPLMGATSFILTSVLLMGFLWLINKYDWFSLRIFLQNNLESFRLIWIFTSIILLGIAGALDDLGKISTKYRFLIVGVAILVAIFLGGLKIETLSFPFQDLNLNVFLLPQLLAFLWLGFCLFATKLLDGLDGLVSSVGVVAFLTIASISALNTVNQPLIFIFSLIWAFGILGFLPYNFPSAKMYLGDGGSMIIGFMIGVFSILSGAKIATAVTVLGWFILDIFVVWTIRLLQRKNPLTTGDRNHWHHRLLSLGLNKRQVLVLTVFLLIITSQLGILLTTQDKILIPIFQMIFILVSLYLSYFKMGKR